MAYRALLRGAHCTVSASAIGTRKRKWRCVRFPSRRTASQSGRGRHEHGLHSSLRYTTTRMSQNTRVDIYGALIKRATIGTDIFAFNAVVVRSRDGTIEGVRSASGTTIGRDRLPRSWSCHVPPRRVSASGRWV